MKINRFLLLFAPAVLAAQPLDPATLLKPLGESWPSYSGDYSGKRYSSLTQINQSNVKNLTLAWVSKVVTGTTGRPGAPVIVGGEGTEMLVPANIRASILQVNGILYLSTPDNAWAVAYANILVNEFKASIAKYPNLKTIPASASLGADLPTFIRPDLAPTREK